MTIKQSSYTVPRQESSTSAPGFHLSETLDWSSLFVQIKNKMIFIPAEVLQHDASGSSKRNFLDGPNWRFLPEAERKER